MKKVKSAIVLALALTMSTTLVACKKGEETLSPPKTESSEIVSTLPPEEEVSSEDLTPPPIETPPTTPETEETPPPSNTPEVSTPTTPPIEEPVKTKAQYIRLTGEGVNIRSGAGTSYKVLSTGNEGSMYALIEKTGSWYKTYYRNQTAYISTSYAAVVNLEKSDTEKVEKVISEGYKLLGTPYVYGAIRLHDGKGNMLSSFSVHKFDCSSLIQYIFYKGANKLLDVTTRTQVKQGKYVKKSELQRGDCIFFTNEERQHKTGIERVGHVALYLGDNYILHTASDYARIEKMSTKRWSFYIEARRFL